MNEGRVFLGLGFRSIDHQHILDHNQAWIRFKSTSALRLMFRIWEFSVLASRLGPDVSMRSCHTGPIRACQSSSVIAVGDIRKRRHLMPLALIITSRTMRPCGCGFDRSALALGVVSTSSEPRCSSTGHLVVIIVNKQQSRYEKEKTIVVLVQHLAHRDELKFTTQVLQTLSQQSRSYKPAYTSDTDRPQP